MNIENDTQSPRENRGDGQDILTTTAVLCVMNEAIISTMNHLNGGALSLVENDGTAMSGQSLSLLTQNILHAAILEKSGLKSITPEVEPTPEVTPTTTDEEE